MTDFERNTSGDQHTAGGAGAATAKAGWNEEQARTAQTPYEQNLASFINRRIAAHPNLTLKLQQREMQVVEYFPGGTGFGKLKGTVGSAEEPLIVDVDSTILEMLLTKIAAV